MSRSDLMGSFKRAIVEAIMADTGYGVARAEELFASLSTAAVDLIASADKTVIRGLGTFTWVNRGERRMQGGLFGDVVPSYEHLKFRSYRAIKERREDVSDR